MVGLMATSSKRACAIPKSATPSYTQVCCPESPCPCGSPLLSCPFPGDTQTQFCLSLYGIFGSQCAQSLFEPSGRLCQVWGLILNVIFSLLPSCWGFSFALGWVSPQSCSSTMQPLLRCLPFCWGFAALGVGVSSQLLQHWAGTSPAPTVFLGLLSPWTWGSSSQSLPHHTATAPDPLINKNPKYIFM